MNDFEKGIETAKDNFRSDYRRREIQRSSRQKNKEGLSRVIKEHLEPMGYSIWRSEDHATVFVHKEVGNDEKWSLKFTLEGESFETLHFIVNFKAPYDSRNTLETNITVPFSYEDIQQRIGRYHYSVERVLGHPNKKKEVPPTDYGVLLPLLSCIFAVILMFVGYIYIPYQILKFLFNWIFG